MSWSEFVHHNRRQKITALLLALMIWFTVSRKLRQGGGVRVTLSGSSRMFEGVPVRLLSRDGLPGKYSITPPTVTVTLRGDPGVLNRYTVEQIQAFVSLDATPTGQTSEKVEVVAAGCEVVEVSTKEVLIRPLPATTTVP